MDTKVCGRCGQGNRLASYYCMECGWRLDNAPETDTTTTIASAETKHCTHCTHCGHKNSPTSAYCNTCGWRLESDKPKNLQKPQLPVKSQRSHNLRNSIVALIVVGSLLGLNYANQAGISIADISRNIHPSPTPTTIDASLVVAEIQKQIPGAQNVTCTGSTYKPDEIADCSYTTPINNEIYGYGNSRTLEELFQVFFSAHMSTLTSQAIERSAHGGALGYQLNYFQFNDWESTTAVCYFKARADGESPGRACAQVTPLALRVVSQSQIIMLEG